MRHHLHLLWLFIRTSFQIEATFRVGFTVKFLLTAASMVTGIFGLTVVFQSVPTVFGWSFPQALALTAIYLLLRSLMNIFLLPSLDSLSSLGGDVWSGRFDYTLLTPVNTQFLVSCRKWSLWSAIEVILNLIILGITIVLLHRTLTVLDIIFFILDLCIGLLIIYAFFLSLASAAMWYQGVPLIWIFDNLLQFGRYPGVIYPGWLQIILTWVIPVCFITTVPAQTLGGNIAPATQLGGMGVALLLFFVASYIFRKSLRRYGSASS